jgi:hypothetical protein
VFSDYNKEVIEFATIPNVIANCPTAIQQHQQHVVQQFDASAHMTNSSKSSSSSADHRKRDEQHCADSKHDDTAISSSSSTNTTKSAAVFYSGDWLSLPKQLLQHDGVCNQFDLILTAETLYTEQAAIQVNSMCINVYVKQSNGVIYCMLLHEYCAHMPLIV